MLLVLASSGVSVSCWFDTTGIEHDVLSGGGLLHIKSCVRQAAESRCAYSYKTHSVSNVS
jgi:hypothetical protein